MKKTITFLTFIFSIVGFSQTKLIAHKSHSGSNSNFRIALENKLFDIEKSNLGQIPITTETYQKLDSVIYISKNKVVCITKEYSQRYYKYNKEKHSSPELIKITKDTVIVATKNNKKLNLNTAKTNIIALYNNKKITDSTVYSGFDKKVTKTKKKTFIAPLLSDKPNFPTQNIGYFILFELTLLVSIFSWKIHNYRKLNY